MEGLGSPSLGMQLPPQAMQSGDHEMNQWIDSILSKNTHMNFVDRVVRPELYPTLPHKKGIATHLMAWGDIDGKPSVFPTIIYDPNSQGLKKLSMDEAFDHAMKTKEFIPFNSEDEADLFSQQYKRHWRDGKGPKGYQP